MRVFLDCEFTKLSAAAKLISLALVAEDGREFYVELLDAWKEEDCSDFVKEIVLPQLWGGSYALPIVEARMSLLRFLTSFKKEVEIVTDAPQYDWELFATWYMRADDGPESFVISLLTQRPFLRLARVKSCLTTRCSTLGLSPACLHP